MIDMTKQYTYNDKPVRIYADGSDTDNSTIHGAYKSETSGRWVLNIFNDSELEEVWQPKGENRHLYADVWHEWAEDTTKEIQLLGNDGLWYSPITALNLQARIKPSEPVYEWQWLVREFNDTNFYVVGQGQFYTEEEIGNWNAKKRIEETKRIRQ